MRVCSVSFCKNKKTSRGILIFKFPKTAECEIPIAGEIPRKRRMVAKNTLKNMLRPLLQTSYQREEISAGRYSNIAYK